MEKKTNFVKLYRDHHDFIDEILGKLEFLADATEVSATENVWGLKMMYDFIAEAKERQKSFWEEIVTSQGVTA